MEVLAQHQDVRLELSQEAQLCLRGIHIQESWAKRIYDGEKTVEARTWKPGCYSGENWLIETPDKPKRGKREHAEITGVISFGTTHEYSCYEEWRDDFKRHCVEEGSSFDWNPERQKKMYAWEIVEARRLATPIPAPPNRCVKGSKAHTACVTFEN